MTKCAVGAMLFGGTLGLAQAASAAVVTFLNTAPGTATSYLASSYSFIQSGTVYEGVSNSFAGGSLSSTSTTNSVVLDWTAPQSNIMKASRSAGTLSASTLNNVYGTFQRVFTVTGGSAVWNGSLANNGSTSTAARSFVISNVDSTTGEIGTSVVNFFDPMTGNQVESFSGILAEGTYAFYTQFYIAPNTSLSTFATFSIPAPGALALLGAAGLVGSRRRRA
jgi:hypothetical protein